eukprot:585759-Amorphochlora_amoeboformis.AAC.1
MDIDIIFSGCIWMKVGGGTYFHGKSIDGRKRVPSFPPSLDSCPVFEVLGGGVVAGCCQENDTVFTQDTCQPSTNSQTLPHAKGEDDMNVPRSDIFLHQYAGNCRYDVTVAYWTFNPIVWVRYPVAVPWGISIVVELPVRIRLAL